MPKGNKTAVPPELTPEQRAEGQAKGRETQQRNAMLRRYLADFCTDEDIADVAKTIVAGAKNGQQFFVELFSKHLFTEAPKVIALETPTEAPVPLTKDQAERIAAIAAEPTDGAG